MNHDLKIWPEFFEAVEDGSKTFEIRRNDRDYKVGDTLMLREFVPSTGLNCARYTGREILVEVTYITDFGMMAGYVALAFKKGVKPMTEHEEHQREAARTAQH